MEKIVTVKLDNGITIVGTVESVNDFARKTGMRLISGKYHYSQSKGEWVEISTMPATYLKNVMVKMIEKVYFGGNRNASYIGLNPSPILFTLLSSNEEFRSLMKEYIKKTETVTETITSTSAVLN